MVDFETNTQLSCRVMAGNASNAVLTTPSSRGEWIERGGKYILRFKASAKDRVPLEIWGMILRFATIIWGELAIDWDGGLIDFHSVKWELEDSFASTLKTKRTVVLVCQSFYHLAVPFLYEHINIENAEHFRLLTAHLRQKPKLCSFIRRLELKKHDSLAPGAYPSAIMYSEMVARCPELRIICGEYLMSLPRLASVVLPKLHMKSIARLSVNLQTRDDALQFHFLLPGMPSVRVLRLRIAPVECIHGFTLRSDSITLMSTNINSECILGSAHLWNLPSLQHLALIQPTLNNFMLFRPFLVKHGSRLISFQIHDPEHSSDILTEIFTLCPNLRSLIYPFAIHPFFPDELKMPKLEEVAWMLDVREPEEAEEDASDVTLSEQDHLEAQAAALVRDRVPRLGRIWLQFFDFDTFGSHFRVPGSSYSSLPSPHQSSTFANSEEAREDREFWIDYCLKWKARGVEVRDREGFLPNLEYNVVPEMCSDPGPSVRSKPPPRDTPHPNHTGGVMH
ncbi:hypothetical protein SISSUDRAFT_1118378 [Sistotremastrum suecicum HHB10207 ss-3]|uniref:Uncharacterized protein n=1 Tax=Sistotremastrum suecicum HHB10207 ss-3 TaxID=1314776 RepID=A0A166F5X4_9AGAM|nr:hypothetical protein SISSUDRAFT_1118378 [Sistotremastrum suecicum HHB10207 ss-3]